MTKAEVISSIMCDLRYSDSVDFEVDERISARVQKINGEYCIFGIEADRDTDKPISIFCSSATEVRKAIASLGKSIVQM
jgi:hypothetical protein